MTWHIPDLFCEGCEAEHKPGKPCPACRIPGNKTCANCGWCSECASRTVTPGAGTEGDAGECGHEYVLGGVAYGCERTPHEIDGYGPKFRHAAEIDAGFAEGTDEGDGHGPATLVTWGEDGNGDGQDWEIDWGTVAGYGARATWRGEPT
jgi:hypothetical protein